MHQIWKYGFIDPLGGSHDMPKGAEILDLQVQRDVPCIWALVDPEMPKETRSFRIFGTGHDIEHDINLMNHIGTFQLMDGMLVWHLFEVRDA